MNLIKLDSHKYQMQAEIDFKKGYEKWHVSLITSSGSRFHRIWTVIAKVQ